MKRWHFILQALVVVALSGFTSCKSNEANYRAAYDITRERQREMAGVDEGTYTRIEAERTANTAVIMGDSVRMITTYVDIVDGTRADIKLYNVVVGEYKQLFNARSFRNRLVNNGHGSYVVKDSENVYYVVVEGFDTAPEAAEYLKMLNFSEGYELLYCIAFGYPDEAPAAKPRNAEKIKFID